MKFFVAFAALIAVAVAFPNKPALSDEAQLEAIIAAIHSPSTDPATAALLEQQLEAILGGPVIPEPIIAESPIAIGPAIIEANPIAIGPAIIDFPLPDGGAVTAPVVPGPVSPSPVVVGPIAPGQPAPLVQLIVNVNGAAFPAPGPIGGIIAQEPTMPVQIVDEAVDAEHIDAPVVVEPVQIVDVAPVVVEPVQIGAPIIPVPAVNLPDELN